MEEKKHNKKITIILGVFALCAVAISLVLPLFKKNSSPLQEQTPSSAKKSLAMTAMSPADGEVLDPGKVQSFVINFNQPISENTLSVIITEHQVQKDQNTSVSFSESLDDTGRELTLTTKNPIDPVAQYILKIIDTSTNEPVVQATFLGGNVQPTPIVKNNPALQAFLPYKTNHFLLDYDANQNIYNFHFIFDPSSTDDIQAQIDAAKEAATSFIQSKNIDISTVVINWDSQ